MKNKNTSFEKYGKPIVVLVAICLVISFLLAATYKVAAPIIAERTKADADAARQQLLPDADSFTQYDGDLVATDDGKVVVTDVYSADNKCGVVITVDTKSFGGTLTEMVGIDADGAITGIVITSHADTPGVGTRAQSEEHLSQYVGLTELQDTSCKKDPTVDHVTGASVSSNAIHYGVYMALEQYKEMGGVQ